MSRTTKAALISVSDKTGIVELGRGLTELGFQILTTGGTGTLLAESGIPIVPIEEYTGQSEMLGGRVKTLHPKIHAGLLARRDNPSDMNQLESEGILPIDVAVVNLYPFEQNLASDKASDPAQMVELIDIGGPTMLRAAAKNLSAVFSVIDPNDYDDVLAALSETEPSEYTEALRLRLSQKVFSFLARYNLEIGRYFSGVQSSAQGQLSLFEEEGVQKQQLASISGTVLERKQPLRYGENPHQSASYYVPLGDTDLGWTQRNGKGLSYNNFLDFDAAWRMLTFFPEDQPTVVILKHLNPCGAATRETLTEALLAAKTSDPRSHFGGIIACNQGMGIDTAREVTSDFAEIVVAPSYSEEALAELSRKKNLRVLEVDLSRRTTVEMRSLMSGVLIQETDREVSDPAQAKVGTDRVPSEGELSDLRFAWNLCAHVKSNAIVIVKGGLLVATGAGQMSRVDAVEVALHKAAIHQHDLSGAVAASDAFFPFPDALEALAEAGVTSVIVPSGAKRDEEIAERANQLGISLLFVGDRHFRH